MEKVNSYTRKKRSSRDESEKVHHEVKFSGLVHHLVMQPNHVFVSPGGRIEERGSDSATNGSKITFQPLRRMLCHYNVK